MKKTLLISRLLFLGIFLLPSLASAARLYFDPVSPTSQSGAPFAVTAYLDPEGQELNAVAGSIDLLGNHTKITKILDANSVVNMWVESPQISDNGQSLRFAGIMPNGFAGVLSPFYRGGRPGKLFTLVIESQADGPKALVWRDSQALINDGVGTSASVATTDAKILIGSNLTNLSPVPALDQDQIAPDDFIPTIVAANKSTLNQEWLVAFGTRDHQTGIDYYEVAEHRDPQPSATDWQRATSPHVLRDQSRRHYVSVRAVDLAGNQRLATLPPPSSTATGYSRLLLSLIILLCFVVFFVRYYFSRPR